MVPSGQRSYSCGDVHDECQRFLHAVAGLQQLMIDRKPLPRDLPIDVAVIAAWGRIERSGVRLLSMMEAWGWADGAPVKSSSDPILDWMQRAQFVDDPGVSFGGKHLAHLVLRCGPGPVEPIDFECAVAEVDTLQTEASWEAEHIESSATPAHQADAPETAAAEVPAPPVVEQPAPAKDVDKARKRGAAGTDPAKALSKEAKALAALVDHPNWTDGQIAGAAGCSRQSLYRMRKYVAAKSVLKDGKDLMPKGSRNGETGDVEAWDRDGGDE